MTQQDDTQFERRDELSRITREVAQGKISRRAFSRRALALGLSAPAIAAALASVTRIGTFAQNATPAAGEEVDLANLSPDIPEPSSPVKVTFQSWIDTTGENFQSMLKQFHELHPNIKIDPVSVSIDEASQKLTTQIAGGTAPDSVYVDAGTVADFASRNALVNVDDYIAKSKAIDVNDYVEAFKVAAVFEDHMYGLPIDGETTGLFYRTDLFKAAGIEKPPTTWDEFKADAEKLTQPDKHQYGFVLFAPEAAYYYYSWLWQAGGDLLSADGKQVLFNNDVGKRAAEFYIGLKKYAPPDYLNSNSWDGRVAFANGQVAMYVAGAWLAGTLQDEFPDANGKWATAPLPIDKKCATQTAGDVLVLPSSAKNQDAAWKWIEFLSAPQNMLLWNLGTKEHPTTLLPPRKSLLDDPRLFENNPVMKGFAEQMTCGVANTIANPDWPAIETALNESLGKAIYGDETASDALDEAAAEADDILKK
ncbi:MAG: ABC transporter substrate-binding protein [Thermomicrobiales bacterium]